MDWKIKTRLTLIISGSSLSKNLHSLKMPQRNWRLYFSSRPCNKSNH